jgi:hypothetical protein
VATKYLSATANYSTAAWLDAPAGSATTAPGTSDDVDINGKTLTVDQNVTVANIVGTGTLIISGNRTINANVGSDTSAFGVGNIGAGQTVVINGNVRGGTATKLSCNGGPLTINGNAFGGTSVNVRALTPIGSGVVNLNGDATGGSAGFAHAISMTGGTLTHTGILIAGSNATSHGLSISSGTATITGGATGSGSVGSNGFNQTGGTVALTGNLVDGSVGTAFGKTGGTFNYTPTSTNTATIGGKVMYPTAGSVRAQRSMSGGYDA